MISPPLSPGNPRRQTNSPTSFGPFEKEKAKKTVENPGKYNIKSYLSHGWKDKGSKPNTRLQKVLEEIKSDKTKSQSPEKFALIKQGIREFLAENDNYLDLADWKGTPSEIQKQLETLKNNIL